MKFLEALISNRIVTER